MKSVCIYCGASENVAHHYLDIAFDMGVEVADRGIKLIFGGGGTGLMGAVADGALSKGGEVIGIIPEFFNTVEKTHNRLSSIEVVVDMHERKARMAELAEGFIALPGGFGTMEELFEVITWYQVGLHNKPIAILNSHDYYDSLINFIHHVKAENFTRSNIDELLIIENTPAKIIERLID